MNKILSILAALIMLAAVFVPMAGASVPTTATITGTGATPVVLYKFELNDEEVGITTGNPDHRTNPPNMDLDAETQVYPNSRLINDGIKTVEIFTVVSATADGGVSYQPSAVAKVDVKVWYPKTAPNVGHVGLQTYKSTLSGDLIELTWAANQAEIQGILDRATDDDCGESCRVITDANETEIMSHLMNGEWRFYKTSTDLKYYDVSGWYLTEVKATAQGMVSDPLYNYFEYKSIKSLNIDFTNVVYGSLTPGADSKLSGNAIFGDAPRTIRNEGNDPFQLNISADPMEMTPANAQNRIESDDLDATVYGVATYAILGNGYVDLGNALSDPVNPALSKLLSLSGVLFNTIVPPDTWDPSVEIYNAATQKQTGVKLETGTRAIDFSIHVPGTISNGDYSGTIYLNVVPTTVSYT
jgi:hypothetical protein